MVIGWAIVDVTFKKSEGVSVSEFHSGGFLV